ncbi:uncharacterized protein LOC120847570 [Ixodes scapularis]|uniref:uncharacterized protein LOC120847570 n=1 Tax=Ixodes scapularis TaxID=6945 RepID=UPI001A9DFCC8|nr:uncharacterized protein LOC120847570 [Ixodes scapularis]
MISTRILLPLAALALACIAGGSANRGQGNPNPENGCPRVSEDSFRRLNQSTTKRPQMSPFRLGQICQYHSRENRNAQCIGDPSLAFRNCTLCCACSDGAAIFYFDTTAPNGFPCKNKGHDKCNDQGKCKTK